MRDLTTKEKIFDASLELFSQKGFTNSSIRQIANKVGIKESSIYNHYPSKQAILDDILLTFTDYFGDDLVEDTQMDELLEKDPLLFYHVGSEGFRQLIKNEKIMKIFRLIFIQMYQDAQIAEYFRKHILEEPLKFWTSVFAKLIEKRHIKNLNPEMLAREYYAYAIFLLLEIFIENNSFPEEEIDRLFEEAESHAKFLFESVGI
ncbi:MAG: TetR/AcrR family transcriptional regulator [Methanobrevibacter sp.]|uniref:TetR/AcrR family transcriptional regulator n=1 Tax=Methanobrevibacter sp. TaxID=66852 RepID=UPI003F117389